MINQKNTTDACACDLPVAQAKIFAGACDLPVAQARLC